MRVNNCCPAAFGVICLGFLGALLLPAAVAGGVVPKSDHGLTLSVRFTSDPSTPQETMFLVELRNASRTPVVVQRCLLIDYSLNCSFRDAQNHVVPLWRKVGEGVPGKAASIRLLPGKSICQTFFWSDWFQDRPQSVDTVFLRLEYYSDSTPSEQRSITPGCTVMSPWIRLQFRNGKIVAASAGRTLPKALTEQ